MSEYVPHAHSEASAWSTEIVPEDALLEAIAENDRLRVEIEALCVARDTLREEVERQAAEIERLRNKKAQSCACGAGRATWCPDCLRAEVDAERARAEDLARAAIGVIPAAPLAELATLAAERDRSREKTSRLREAMDNRFVEMDRARIAMNARLGEILDQMRDEIAKEVGT